ncbi:hypothetical protein [Natrialba chahannaoensis]|uniref:hypothetical protein n=1 Tax=Natrialba chahannaoensis TaxID=68911 RepID=UPI001268992F|nr:hypothetical protein [Natrialba chahannaoensis]
MDKNESIRRRKILKIAGTSTVALPLIGSTVTASEESNNTTNNEAQVNTAFEPGDKNEVRNFTVSFGEIDENDKQDRIWERLGNDQKEAVAKAVQPKTIKTSVREGTLKSSPEDDHDDYDGTDYKHVTKAEGSWGVTSFEFHHEITWEYNDFDSTVQNWENNGWTENLYYGWSDGGNVKSKIDSCNQDVCGNFSSIRRRKMEYAGNPVGSLDYYPESELGGYGNGKGLVLNEDDGI